MSLTKAQLKYLRGICHHLKPVVSIGAKGLTENVMHELDLALTTHELIKVKLRLDRDTRRELTAQITQQCQAELVQSIGQTACYYRQHPEKPELALP